MQGGGAGGNQGGYQGRGGSPDYEPADASQYGSQGSSGYVNREQNNYGAPPPNAGQGNKYGNPTPQGGTWGTAPPPPRSGGYGGGPPQGSPPPPGSAGYGNQGRDNYPPPVQPPFQGGAPGPNGGPGGYGSPPPPYGQAAGNRYGTPPSPGSAGRYGAANDNDGSEPQDEYQTSIMETWDEHMTDFEPSDMLTINIPSRTDETFFEYITEVPSKVRGAYYIGSGEKKLVDFWIIDPSNRIFNSIQGKNEGLFIFDAYQSGIYQFVFANSRYWESKDLTFAIHFGNHTDDHASAEHLDPFHDSLNSALHDIKNLYSEVKFAVGRQDAHNTTVKGSMRTHFWISVLETLCIIGLAAAQIYFVKLSLIHI